MGLDVLYVRECEGVRVSISSIVANIASQRDLQGLIVSFYEPIGL